MVGMAIDRDFSNFRAVYDELTDEVGRARYQFLSDHLANWFQTLDTTPRVASVMRRLEASVDYAKWRQNLTSIGVITWPKDRDQAIAMKLQLFRSIAQKKEDVSRFGLSYTRRGRGKEENAHEVIEQIFMPMARELRRYLEGDLGEVPASDRVVRLDHNSGVYRQAIDALEKLEAALKGANDYPDPEDKEQRIAEISATRRLFQSTLVRVGAVVALLGPGITYFATHLAGSAIDKAASGVIDAITALIGSIF